MITTSYKNRKGKNYTIPQLDLSVKPANLESRFEYLYKNTVVDDSTDYLAHPDSVLLKNGNILTLYPAGHGKGAILNKISSDGGKSYTSSIESSPKSWKDSLETPTVYRLEFCDPNTPDKLILISANSRWPNMVTPGGFNCSVSCDEGKTWSEFKTFYSMKEGYKYIPMVAMASLTRLKENGEFADKWMGFFHDKYFRNYKTILTFDKSGNAHWSRPVPYFKSYRKIERRSNMCEVECIRSDYGKGDELCLITRSNSKKENSLISFSHDEGETWSEPVYAPASLNGERLKADYTKDGRLFITFRSIERDPQKIKENYDKSNNWFSEGYVAWVGTYDDLKNGTEGQYRIKIAHTYLDSQTEPAKKANADTGYCGNVVLNDGTIVTSSYGQFGEKKEDGKYKTYIISKRINLDDTDELVKRIK